MYGKRSGNAPRRHERHLTEGLTCVTGDVLDLSAGGMRIRSKERPPVKAGEATTFTIRAGGKAVPVPGKIAWVKRASLLGGPYDYGVQFVGISAQMERVLEQIAMYGFVPDGAMKSAAGSSPYAGRAWGSGDGTGRQSRITASADLPCFYETLGLGNDATDEEIKQAYRGLAKRMHPDVCKEPDAAERFAFVTRVYEVLIDPELRARYDDAMERRRAA